MSLSQAMTDPTSAANGTKLGLAIGIPLAVVSLFAVIAVVWVFFRRKITQKADDEVFRIEKPKQSGDSWPASTNTASEDHVTEENIQTPPLPPPSMERRTQPPHLLKRLSRMVIPQDFFAGATEFRSPVILRSFNLNREKEEKEHQERPAHIPGSPRFVRESDPELRPGVKWWASGESVLSAVSTVPDSYTGKTLIVATPYKRKLADELSVSVGETVVIKRPHSDGWAAVRLLSSGKEGVVPMMCLRH